MVLTCVRTTAILAVILMQIRINPRRQSSPKTSPAPDHPRGRNKSPDSESPRQAATGSTPHQSAMNRAMALVDSRIDSMLTRSSKPCTFSAWAP